MSTKLGGDHGEFRGAVFPSEEEWARIGSRLRWSTQELRVVRLLVGGASCKRAAFLGQLALSTVHTYRRRAMRKARVDTLPGLIWTVVGARDDVRRPPDETQAAQPA